MKKAIALLLLGVHISLAGFPLQRVILASDAHPMYLDFWPLVAQAWTSIVGIRPTLALIADDSVVIDESLGEVIRFAPIAGVPTSFYAQVIRLFLPLFFEDDFCIISDIDMLPLIRSYFWDSVKPYTAEDFVLYRVYYDTSFPYEKYPMCYAAGRGSVFKEILQINSVEDIASHITHWWHEYAQGENLGWNTDEVIFARRLQEWHKKTGRWIKLGHHEDRRIDRRDFWYDVNLLRSGYYIDSHMVRPYSMYRHEINTLARYCGLKVS